MLGNTDVKYEIEHLQTSTGIVFQVDRDTELPNGDKVNVIRIVKSKDLNSYIVTVQRGLPPFHIVVYNPAYVFTEVVVSLD